MKRLEKEREVKMRERKKMKKKDEKIRKLKAIVI